jgi:hypothetical protein
MHRGRPVGESFDHRPPGWIRQSRKRCTQFIHNRMVVDGLSMSSVNFAIPDFGSLIPHVPRALSFAQFAKGGCHGRVWRWRYPSPGNTVDSIVPTLSQKARKDVAPMFKLGLKVLGTRRQRFQKASTLVARQIRYSNCRSKLLPCCSVDPVRTTVTCRLWR